MMELRALLFFTLLGFLFLEPGFGNAAELLKAKDVEALKERLDVIADEVDKLKKDNKGTNKWIKRLYIN